MLKSSLLLTQGKVFVLFTLTHKVFGKSARLTYMA